MTRDEAVSLMQIVLGFRTDQSANLITALQAAQTKLESGPTKPWFLLSEKSTTTTVANERRVALPTSFLLEHEENGLRYIPADTDEDPVRLVKDSLDQLEDYYKNETGSPAGYCVDGNYIRIFPLPDDAYTLEMYYYKKAAVLSSNIENVWLANAAYYLMGEAGLIVAAALRDKTAIQEFTRWRNEGSALLDNENESRKHENSSYQIGGAH